MKFPNRKLVIIFLLVSVMILSSAQVHAEESQKGFFGRLWERVRSWGYGAQETPAVKPPGEVPGADSGEKAMEEKPEAPPKKPAPEREAPREKKMPSKDEMIEGIKRRLDIYPEIVDVFPDLSFREVAGEKEYFYVTPQGVEVDFETLDEEILYPLHVRVARTATQINTERIMKMLRQQEQIRRMQQLQNQIPTQPASPPPQPPSVPTTHIPLLPAPVLSIAKEDDVPDTKAPNVQLPEGSTPPRGLAFTPVVASPGEFAKKLIALAPALLFPLSSIPAPIFAWLHLSALVVPK